MLHYNWLLYFLKKILTIPKSMTVTKAKHVDITIKYTLLLSNYDYNIIHID